MNDIVGLPVHKREEKTSRKHSMFKVYDNELDTTVEMASGSDEESESPDVSLNESGIRGRKNIRKILNQGNLAKKTQAALKAEQDRKKRIAEKQRQYNALSDKVPKEHEEFTELVLDFDPKTKENLVVVNPNLVKQLKPHQAEGIKFMWDSCFESLKMAKSKSGSGCILAHCMGLGKSLQVVTLVHTLVNTPDAGMKTVLVVAPVSTCLNWANEFNKWLKDVGSARNVNVFQINKPRAKDRADILRQWSRSGGVLIMGYNLFRSLTAEKSRTEASFVKIFKEKLVDPGPDVVVCDEGHILKNEKTGIAVAMSKMKTRRRIVLTGTPFQNNLVEFHGMVQFVKPNLLGTKKEFMNRFGHPIQNGQFEDSTPQDVKLMKRRAHVLHSMLDGLVQRKDFSVLTPYLPPKYEYVIHLKLSDVQVNLYRRYLRGTDVGGGKKLFQDFQNLMWICLHPRALLMKSRKDPKETKEGADNSDEEGLQDSVETDETGCLSETDGPSMVPVSQWWSNLVEEEHLDDVHKSSKLFLFFTILKHCIEIGDKLLAFSQSLYTLDLVEYFLDKITRESQKPAEARAHGVRGFEGTWTKGLDYFRFDGSSACQNRDSWCKSFNRPDNVRAKLFLISTRAGGMGINLTGANRVVIFDACWNPTFDVQALFRVYRLGQDKPCYIYRFLSKGTMEEKIYERQVAKLSTSLRVIDEHQIDRHFSHSALAELYLFDPEGSELQGTPVLPKDRLMAELVETHSDIILSYHQHDSLLENQEDQELSEEERKDAWAEFENDKKKGEADKFKLDAMLASLDEIKSQLKVQYPSWTDHQIRLSAQQTLRNMPDFKKASNPTLLQQNQWQAPQLIQHLSARIPQRNFAASSTAVGLQPHTNPFSRDNPYTNYRTAAGEPSSVGASSTAAALQPFVTASTAAALPDPIIVLDDSGPIVLDDSEDIINTSVAD